MKLLDVATVVRSKNSGPFEITLDVLFDDAKVYEAIKASGLINKALIADLYSLDQDSITELVFFDQALGFKVTFARKVSSGTAGDRDVYGAQQSGLLMEWEFELDEKEDGQLEA